MKKNLIITFLFFVSIFKITNAEKISASAQDIIKPKLEEQKNIYTKKKPEVAVKPDKKKIIIDVEAIKNSIQKQKESGNAKKGKSMKLVPLSYSEPFEEFLRLKKIKEIPEDMEFDEYLQVKIREMQVEEFLRLKKIKEIPEDMEFDEYVQELKEEIRRNLKAEAKKARAKKEEEKRKLQIKIKKFKEEMKRKTDETQKNLNFINNIFKDENLIKLNCFKKEDVEQEWVLNLRSEPYIVDNPHYRIFIDDKLKKAVEIWPSGKYKILYNVISNNNFFLLDLHSVKTPSKYQDIDGEWRKVKSFYSKEEIIINHVEFNPEYADQLEEYMDNTDMRYWLINRHTGISETSISGDTHLINHVRGVSPFAHRIQDVIIKDNDNKPLAILYLSYHAPQKFICSSNSF